MITLNERLKIAHDTHIKGSNCAQCIIEAFGDITGVDPNTASKISAGLGGGVGGTGETCGAVLCIAMLDGFHYPADNDTRNAVYREVREDMQRFKDINGSTICRELRISSMANPANKKIVRKPCLEYIYDAIRIIHNRLVEG